MNANLDLVNPNRPIRVSGSRNPNPRTSSKYGEKKPIKKNHIKEFGGRDARRRPRDKLGTSQGHLGHLGLIYV